ncbi:hypothetical protein FLONG3_6982 [Fusarium longipes]|uniref:Uncharacterized protein n=1 Tax=Fusarium longipes TaxID=694270 RepID=A0A395SI79_9HYPO|nr:hypothetical protein FLONG3_6982 [Fusarium longipes]
MPTKITDLPLEVRQQIFGEYFAAQDGYVYNEQSGKLRHADGTPIDLSLIYTCRYIANDCKHLPLALNTIHFSTIYREDWRSLAGCFNLAASYYNVLQQDLVLHLAHLVTPEMHAQLEKTLPTFRSKLEAEREFHFHAWDTGDAVGAVEGLENADTSEPVQPAVCEFVRDFYFWAVDKVVQNLPTEYYDYHNVDKLARGLQNSMSRERLEPLRDNHRLFYHRRWNHYSREVDQCLSQCLRLVADKNPTEFANRVYACLPQWVGKYRAEEFFDLRFEDWAIPSRTQVAHVLHRLGVPDLVWKLPDIWHYESSYFFKWKVYNHIPRDRWFDEFEHPTINFDSRTRTKIRFSAAAAAIRFLDLLPHQQRTQIRTIILHEDLLSVNKASIHGLGLVPFLRENSLLRVQRRVSFVHCILNDLSTDLPQLDKTHKFPERLHTFEFVPALSRWLLDNLAVVNAGIPADSFALLLESGPYADRCTEILQQLVHFRIKLNRAWDECLNDKSLPLPEDGLLISSSGSLLEPNSSAAAKIAKMTFMVTTGEEFKEAFEQLVSQTSTTLRCDFNPGVPENHHALINEVKAHPQGLLYFWKSHLRPKQFELPRSLFDRETLAKSYDRQSYKKYRQSVDSTSADAFEMSESYHLDELFATQPGQSSKGGSQEDGSM